MISFLQCARETVNSLAISWKKVKTLRDHLCIAFCCHQTSPWLIHDISYGWNRDICSPLGDLTGMKARPSPNLAPGVTMFPVRNVRGILPSPSPDVVLFPTALWVTHRHRDFRSVIGEF